MNDDFEEKVLLWKMAEKEGGKENQNRWMLPLAKKVILEIDDVFEEKGVI